jgi:hypothetical protein
MIRTRAFECSRVRAAFECSRVRFYISATGPGCLDTSTAPGCLDTSTAPGCLDTSTAPGAWILPPRRVPGYFHRAGVPGSKKNQKNQKIISLKINNLKNKNTKILKNMTKVWFCVIAFAYFVLTIKKKRAWPVPGSLLKSMLCLKK